MFDRNPWLTIWVHPSKTIQKIISVNPKYRLWTLSIIYGFCSLMNMVQIYAPGYRFSFPGLLIGVILLSPFWGYFLFSVFSWLVYVVGKWIGGIGSFIHLRVVAAWASVPFVVNVFAWIVMIIVFGHGLFKDFPGGNILSPKQMNLILTILLVKLAMSIASFIIYLQGLSAVHDFSIAKAILTVIIVAFILLIFSMILWITIASTCGHFFDLPLITFKL